jgi:uncharacterized membrane protein YphA (DoxX/SURF4 family)
VTRQTAPQRPLTNWSRVVPWLGTVARLGLAGVWLAAGASKIGDLSASARAVHAYELTPYDVSVLIGSALPFVELALGVLLLAGLATRLLAAVSAALLTIFMVGIASAWARGLAIDCGCFGPGGELPAGVDPSYLPELGKNVVFLLLAGFLLVYPRTRLSLDAWLGAAPAGDEDRR